MKKGVIGIDEVGRGPIAGPLAIGAVHIFDESDVSFVEGVSDSKLMSADAREVWARRIDGFCKEGILAYVVTFVSPQKIDVWGMRRALRYAVAQNLKKLCAPNDTRILLDGGLFAPDAYVNQQTIIKGDFLEPAISSASIVAKVRRDTYMKRMAQKYPLWGFEAHKGYGTRRHMDAVREHGMSDIHRRSFCRRIGG